VSIRMMDLTSGASSIASISSSSPIKHICVIGGDDRHGVAAGPLGRLANDREFGGVVLRCERARRPPAVGVPAGDAQHARPGGTDPDRWDPAFVGFGVQPRVLETIEVTLEVHPVRRCPRAA